MAAAFFAAFFTAKVVPRLVDFLPLALFFLLATDFFVALPPLRAPILLVLATDFFAAFFAGAFFTAAFFAAFLAGDFFTA